MQPEWPADKVERRAVAALIPYARNARTHSPEQVDQIAASIREWGWTVPLLVDDEGGIIAGHGRALAAHKGFVTLAGFTCFYCLPGESHATRFQCLSLASPRSKTASTCSM